MKFDDKIIDIPDTLPMLPVRDIVVFPYMILPLYVGRESSIRGVEEALAKNRLIFLASQKDISEENPKEGTIFQSTYPRNFKRQNNFIQKI
jgi:ATP-dependent Lon protease